MPIMSSPKLSIPDKSAVVAATATATATAALGSPSSSSSQLWDDDSTIVDIDHFVKSLSSVKAKGIRPDLVGSIISHYATKWLPELSATYEPAASGRHYSSPEGSMAIWIKKRYFVETLVGLLPPEKDCLPCNFLLRLLRLATMVEVEEAYLADVEARVAWQLDQATLKELMIPAFSHTSTTLLDVGLVLRLVRRFVGLDEAVKSGAAIVKVAKLVDSYLAEAAVDGNLRIEEFEALAGALPAHARATDDGLYRAMDTYLKAHPNTSKQERKSLFKLIDTRKLSSDASLHIAQNDRLPVRAVIQVLFSEQMKLNRLTDGSGSFSGQRSPRKTTTTTPPSTHHYASTPMLDLPSSRCPSKRELAQQEIRKLRDDVVRLQIQCHSLQSQLDRVTEKKKKNKMGGYNFRWKSLLFKNVDGVEKSEDGSTVMHHQSTPQAATSKKSSRVLHGGSGKGTPPSWRNSMS